MPDTKFPILLLAERGLDRSHAKEVAGWFRRCPGPISLKVVNTPVDLLLDDDGKLTSEAAFKVLNEMRNQNEVSPEHFVCLLTKSLNVKNWYAVQDENCLRNGFLHVGDFTWVTSAPASVISTPIAGAAGRPLAGRSRGTDVHNRQ